MTFYGFPRTPHLGSGSSDTGDGDRRVNIDALVESDNEKKYTLTIQEKIDGANVSLHFEQDWVPILQKRSGIIENGERQVQYGVFKSWVNENLSELWEICETEFVLFGEFVWARHSVPYTKLPSYFIAFDLMEKQTGRFLSYAKLMERIEKRIAVVPLLFTEQMTYQKLTAKGESLAQSLIQQSKFSGETSEGVYLRIEEGDYVKERVKLRRKTFVCGEEYANGKVTNFLADNQS